MDFGGLLDLQPAFLSAEGLDLDGVEGPAATLLVDE
jgi:hypothetical protein